MDLALLSAFAACFTLDEGSPDLIMIPFET